MCEPAAVPALPRPQYEDALDRSIAAGFVLEADRATALAEAGEIDFG